VSTPAGTIPPVTTPPLPVSAAATSAKRQRLTAHLVDRLDPFRPVRRTRR
jgi:hypothetical protein